MRYNNVKLVFQREMRDQLRDRRSLFTIGVIPLLLYPLMGMAMLQMAQFMKETRSNVLIVGASRLGSATLFEDDQIADPKILEERKQQALEFEVVQQSDRLDELFRKVLKLPNDSEERRDWIRQILKSKKSDLVMWVAPWAPCVPHAVSSTELIDSLHESGEQGDQLPTLNGIGEISEKRPAENKYQVFLFCDSSSDRSRMAKEKMEAVLLAWQKSRLREKLVESNIDLEQMQIANVRSEDVGSKSRIRASFWAKVLPFVIMIWALTGAFYPAIDLCAGEKERGTLETLLCSPARRSEIVFGKIMATMSFSLATSVLNLASMAFTGLFVMNRLGGGTENPIGGIGPPPMSAIFWLVLALIPITALFSALAIAVAAFARSSKEGQYYLMPLIMIAMPLVILPMLPASTLNLGTSLIPLTGLMLMLRSLIEGQYAEALAYGGPVTIVTLGCIWLAARWAIGQFNNESVLFRASDHVGVVNLLRFVLRERKATPLLGHAFLCGTLILILKFFVGLSAAPPLEWAGFVKTTLVILVVTVAMPAILMALVMTRDPRASLSIKSWGIRSVPIAIMLALCLHPAFSILSRAVLEIFPPSGDLSTLEFAMERLFGSAPSLLAVLAVMALAPAVFEELAFRGFILNGLRRIRNPWWPILISSLFFGAAHAVIQQSIVTFWVGIVLAMIAVRVGSLLPCIAYHATHNSLSLISSGIYPRNLGGWLPGLVQYNASGGYDYLLFPSTILSLTGFLILIWLWFGGLDSSGKPDAVSSPLPEPVPST